MQLIGMKKNDTPRASLAIRAMEKEARKQHPELAKKMAEEEKKKREQKELKQSLRGTYRGRDLHLLVVIEFLLICSGLRLIVSSRHLRQMPH